MRANTSIGCEATVFQELWSSTVGTSLKEALAIAPRDFDA